MAVVEDSILLSVKQQLGLPKEVTELDANILMHINGAIFTLRQLGIGPIRGFTVYDETQTYEDFLGYGSKEIADVRLYIGYKVQLGFDTPQSSALQAVLQEMITECEWRLKEQADISQPFEEGGEYE